MEEIDGQRPGTSRYVYENYTYWMDSRDDSAFRCTKRKHVEIKCPAIATIDDDGKIHIQNEHTHPEEASVVEELALRNEIKFLARETCDSPLEIFAVAIGRIRKRFPNGDFTMSTSAAEGIVRRERAKSTPHIPQDFEEIEQDEADELEDDEVPPASPVQDLEDSLSLDENVGRAKRPILRRSRGTAPVQHRRNNHVHRRNRRNGRRDNQQHSRISSESRRSNEGTVECKICCENPRNTVFVPCGHIVACSDCLDTLLGPGNVTECCACRTPFTMVLRTYIS